MSFLFYGVRVFSRELEPLYEQYRDCRERYFYFRDRLEKEYALRVRAAPGREPSLGATTSTDLFGGGMYGATRGGSRSVAAASAVPPGYATSGGGYDAYGAPRTGAVGAVATPQTPVR